VLRNILKERALKMFGLTGNDFKIAKEYFKDIFKWARNGFYPILPKLSREEYRDNGEQNYGLEI